MLPFHIPPSNELQQIQRIQQLQQLQEQQQRQPNPNLGGRPRSRRVFYTTDPDIAARAAEQDITLIVIDQQELRRFIKKVYLCALIFTMIAYLTWGAVIIIKFDITKFVNIPVFVWIISAFMVLVLLNCIPGLNQNNIVTLILVLCVMFFYIMAGVSIMIYITFQEYIIGVLLTFATQAAIHSAAAFCPQNCLLRFGFFVFVFTTLLIVLPILLIISIFVDNFMLRVSIVLIFAFLLLILSLFQAQYLNGRFDIVPLNEVYTVSLSTFTQSALLLFCFELLYHMLVLLGKKK